MAFNNGGSVNVSLSTFERLRSPFAIRNDLVIAPGDYDYERWQAVYTSDRSRLVSGNLTVESGGFWDGDSTSVTGGLDLKPSQHLTIGATLGRNVVELAGGSFTTTLIGTRVVRVLEQDVLEQLSPVPTRTPISSRQTPGSTSSTAR